ncbi:MAG: DUF502 domain-containing protein [Planctomycetaceae bacterium]
MTSPPPEPPPEQSPSQTGQRRPFHFLLRGLAIALPPVLTLLILIWIGSVFNDYILKPTSWVMRSVIALGIDDSQPLEADDSKPASERFVDPEPWMPALADRGRKYLIKQKDKNSLKVLKENSKADAAAKAALDGQLSKLEDYAWVPLSDGRAVKYTDYAEVALYRPLQMPTTAHGIYMELVRTRHVGILLQLSAVAVLVTVLMLYFIGRLMTVRVGVWMVQKFESGVLGRVPLVSQVYSSVKQVTDFFFTERSVQYSRVVAVEYPRRGLWSIGFLTSDSLLEMTVAAGEPLVTVLMPTSPMPMTGFTVNVPRSEVVDLNVTIDQAFQYCLSCGVLVPPQQKVTPESLQEAIAKRLSVTEAEGNSDGTVSEDGAASSVGTESPQTGTPS